MADEKFYEQKLTKAFAEAFVAADNARQYPIIMNKVLGAKSSVCLRLSQLLHISTSDAEAYINMDNGKFKPGRYMSYCLDEQLKNAFARLEPAITEYGKIHHLSSQREANNITAQKLAVAKQVSAEIKSVFAEQKAKTIIENAYSAAQKQTGIYS